MHQYKAKLIRCVDGDTAEFMVDLGFYVHHKITARLGGVDTPERGQADYKRATLMLENLVIANQDNEGYVIINTNKTGKYGRWLVNIEGVNSVLAEKWPYKKNV
tara:strand:- start:1855 stop:2166 length:312 start_codon:yes stop_codon:yes gene_type:complete